MQHVCYTYSYNFIHMAMSSKFPAGQPIRKIRGQHPPRTRPRHATHFALANRGTNHRCHGASPRPRRLRRCSLWAVRRWKPWQETLGIHMSFNMWYNIHTIHLERKSGWKPSICVSQLQLGHLITRIDKVAWNVRYKLLGHLKMMRSETMSLAWRCDGDACWCTVRFSRGFALSDFSNCVGRTMVKKGLVGLCK